MVGTSANAAEVRKGLGATVGGLVWVQRKNGSWWPGQIVGQEELSETDLAIPRSGTPIKLLGRDDTSVDWFDLQTTKTVKAFRCGDYDTCIEKAKFSAAKRSLKYTKYPRRENAIVCALEIEKAFMLKDYPDSDTRQNGEKVSPSISHPNDDKEHPSEEIVSACEENSNSTQELSQSGISYEETNGLTHIKGLQCRGRKRSRKSPNDSEDDGYEGFKRMKGLNDLGTDAEKKEPNLALPNSSPQSSAFVDNLCGANGMTMGALANGSSTSTLKKKRSQVVHIHELLKRDYPRRPMPKVLENTTMVPVRIICDEFANPFERYDAVSSSYECEDNHKWQDTDLSEGLLPEDDPEILIDVPFVDEELQSCGFSSDCRSSLPTKSYVDAFRGDPGHDIQVQASPPGHDSLDESGLAHFSAGHMNQMEEGASKWQSKGKRNARHVSKGDELHSRWKADVHDRLDPYMIGHENLGLLSPRSNGVVNGFTDRRNHNSVASSQRSFTYHQSRFSTYSNFDSAGVSPRSSHADSLLYEVEVTVEATRSQVQHVPYISLMSKIHGKPITGHPVAVEVLEDGYCDPQSSDYPASGSCELEDEDTEMEVIIKPKSHKKKKAKHRSRLHHRKSSKSKKRHGSSSKKTRKLSSLTGAQKLSLVKRKPMSQASKGPILACIPLKVVFSRINEALNGSRSTHRVSNT